MTLEELGIIIGVPVKGQADYKIKRLRDLARLLPDEEPDDFEIYFVENKKALRKNPKVALNGAVLTTESLASHFPRALVAPDKDIRLAFIKLLEHFADFPHERLGETADAHIHPKAKVRAGATVMPGAVVMEGAVIGEDCRVFPGVVIEPYAEIGEGTTLHPNVVIGHHCLVGKRCTLHAGTVIGSDGFGFHDQDGKRYKIPQIGIVVIGDDVEMGSNCTVDRATIESTEIGLQTKFDDQVHIGHNCRVGRFCYITAATGLGGGVVVEDGVMMSGHCAIAPQTRIAKGTILMGNTGVVQDTEPGVAYFGSPARPAREMHKLNKLTGDLPNLFKRVKELEKKLEASGERPIPRPHASKHGGRE